MDYSLLVAIEDINPLNPPTPLANKASLNFAINAKIQDMI